MGICASCCGRRKKSQDPEREPLLQQNNASAETAAKLALPLPRTNLEKLADVLAAVRVGKLPSQAQISQGLRAALGSSLLDPHALAAATSSARLLGGDALSQSGRRVLHDVREVIEATLEWGNSRNADDKIQDLVYQTEHIQGLPIEADIGVSTKDGDALRAAIPSQTELLTDAVTLQTSLNQLSSLLLTSSAFRLLLSDALTTIRELVADTAARTGSLATAVERVAGAAEEATRPGGADSDVVDEKANAAIAEAGSVLDETRERWARLARESPDRVREAVVGRMQNIVHRAAQTPEYRKASMALLVLIRSYAHRLRAAPLSSTTVTPVVWAEPHLEKAFKDLGELLSRSAGGRDLQPLQNAIKAFTQDLLADVVDAVPGADVETSGDGAGVNIGISQAISGPPRRSDTRAWMTNVGSWLENALRDPTFAISSQGTRQAEQIYDTGHGIFASVSTSINTSDDITQTGESQSAQDLHRIVSELSGLSSALSADAPTARLLASLSSLGTSLPILGVRAGVTASAEAARAPARIRAELLRDLLGWALPRALRLLGALPMPRVEVTSPAVDAAVDALLLTAPTPRGEPANASASLVPDTVLVQSWNELRVDLAPEEDELVPSVVPRLGAGSQSSLPIGSAARGGRVKTVSTIRVRIDGLRISARDVGYYIRYKGPGIVGYEDEGLVSLDVGEPGPAGKGQGVSADVELEFDHDSLDSLFGDYYGDDVQARALDGTAILDKPAEPLFRVRRIETDVPGLALRLDRSKHWILNKLLLQPLVGPIGRVVVKYVVGQQLRGSLEQAAMFGGEVRKEVRRRRHARWHDGMEGGSEEGWTEWVKVASNMMAEKSKGKEEVEAAQPDEEEDTEEPQTETETSVVPTTKGIVVTMTTTAKDTDEQDEQANASGSSGAAGTQAVAQTQIALGVGAQILPGKGGPHDLHVDGEVEAPAQVVRAVLDEVEETIEEEVAVVQHGIETAAETVEQAKADVETAEVRAEVRTQKERKKGGWRSKVFDLA